MSTTILLVELVIIGIEVLIWIVLIGVTAFDFSWLNVLTTSGHDGVLLILFLTTSYVTGILFDRFADGIFSKASDRIKKRIFPNPPKPYIVLRFEIAKGNEYLNNLFEYLRSILRITRSSVINFPLISISGMVLVLVRGTNIPIANRIGLLVTILIFGIIFTILAFYSWKKLIRADLSIMKRFCTGSEAEN